MSPINAQSVFKEKNQIIIIFVNAAIIKLIITKNVLILLYFMKKLKNQTML